MVCDSAEWMVYKTIMSLYIDSAKTFTSLSSAGIVFLLVFREKIIGSKPGSKVNTWATVSSTCFLFCIGCGCAYQYFGIKFLDAQSCAPGANYAFQYLVNHPGFIYGAMLVSFFGAACALMIGSFIQLRETSRVPESVDVPRRRLLKPKR